MNRPPATPSFGLRVPVICLLIAVATLAVYLPVANFDFVNYDDGDYFFKNTHVLGGFSPANIQWAFSSGDAVNWHPLTWLSLMLDAQLFGPGPVAPHVTNVLLHLANAILLFLFLKQVTGAEWRSAVVALFFAIHPLHVESVAWVSERKDVLSGFFAILTLWCYAGYAQAGTAPSRQWAAYSLAVFLFACGLMAKPMLVTLPFVMLLLDFWPLQRFNLAIFPRLLFEKIPFCILSAAVSVVTYMVQRHGGAVTTLSRFPLALRVENVFISYARYLGKTFCPIDLATPYPAPEYSPTLPLILAVLLFAGLCAAALVLRKKYPYVFTGWFWFGGMLVPVIGLVQVGAQAMGDRYMYLPLIGILFIIVWGVGDVCAKYHPPRPLTVSITVLLLLACAARARNQVGVWRDSGTLFGHALAVTKDNYFANLHLAWWYAQNNQVDQSLSYYYRAALISPGNADDLFNAANSFARLGHWPEAIDIYRRALERAPDRTDILNNLGLALARNHQLPDAIACFQQLLKLQPDSAGARNNLASIFFVVGRYQEAAEQFNTALTLKPNDAMIAANLGDTLMCLGQTNNAVQCYTRVLQLQPDNQAIRAKLKALGVQPSK